MPNATSSAWRKDRHNLPAVNNVHPEMILKMTPEEREQMNTLCARIAVEKDTTTFDRLVRQLNDLWEKKHGRVATEQQEKPS